MTHFDVAKGDAVTLTISGMGFEELQVTVSGFAGAVGPKLLLSQRVAAKEATSISFEHEFGAGQLRAFGQLQVDPVLYGKAESRYELAVAMRNASDKSPTLVHASAGTLAPAHRVGEAGSKGCDAPLILIPLKSQPDFDLRVDGNTGVILLVPRDPVLKDADFPCLFGKTYFEPGLVPEFDVLDPRQFKLDRFKLVKKPGLGDLFSLSDDFSMGVGSGELTLPGAGLRGVGPAAPTPAPYQSAPVTTVRIGAGKMSKAGTSRKSNKLSVSTAVPVDKDAKHYPVWYGTNRTPVLRDGKIAGYSAFRDADVHYGRCIVRVPKSHKIGEIGSPLWKRVLKLSDDRLKLEDVIEVEQALFWTSVAAQVRGAAASDRHVVVFIHGYNVSFDDAAIRAAQIGCDLSINGAMAFYSWPSRGTLEGYFADEATVQASAKYITQFLQDIVQRAQAEKVHVIAHSMGNRATLEAVREIVAGAQRRTGVPFSQFILAAPDVDAEYFHQFAEAYRHVASRTTMYVSDRDQAVKASRFLHGSVPRVGLAPPMQIVEGIDTIYAGKVDQSLLGHGYVANAWQLLNDMHQMIHLDAEPAKRTWVRPSDSDDHWVLEGVV